MSRYETYLRKIAGEDVDISNMPVPSDRYEYYLKQIASNGADPEAIAEAVGDWLDEHVDPETGYVLDDTLSIAGAAADAKAAGDEVNELKSALNDIQTATANDVGKALSPKTVTNGKVTEWQFKSISGGGGSGDAAPVIINTVSGAVASFADGGDTLPVKSFVANIDYVQSGEGTPSPENVRPISGWTGCTVYHSGEDTSDPASISVNWQTEAGTVYGGTLNVITGVLTVTHRGVTFDGNTSESDFGIALLTGYTQISWLPYINMGVTGHVFVSDRLGITYSGGAEYKIWGSNPPRMFMGLPTSVQSIADANTWFASNPTTVVYPLATPQTYQLTPHEVTTLLGANNIWATTGNVAVQYRADTKLFVEENAVSDVQINGTSILSEGVANIPVASANAAGVMKVSQNTAGLLITALNQELAIARASDGEIKAGVNLYKPIVPANQEKSAFYALAKAAGDSTQSASNNAVGTYTENAKSAIKSMLGVSEWKKEADITLTQDETVVEAVLSRPYYEFMAYIKVLPAAGTISLAIGLHNSSNSRFVFQTLANQIATTEKITLLNMMTMEDAFVLRYNTDNGNSQMRQSMSFLDNVTDYGIKSISIASYNAGAALLPAGSIIKIWAR